jgi:hypothetical protein
MAKNSLSLDSLDARKASEVPVEFEYFGPDLKPSGLFFKVLGGQSPAVVEQTQRLLNERRKRDAVAAAAPRAGGQADAAFTPVEDDIDFSQKLSAVRLVGWRGDGETDGLTPEEKERFSPIAEAYTPELALKLIRSNVHIKDQVDAVSNDLARFMKASAKA